MDSIQISPVFTQSQDLVRIAFGCYNYNRIFSQLQSVDYPGVMPKLQIVLKFELFPWNVTIWNIREIKWEKNETGRKNCKKKYIMFN